MHSARGPARVTVGCMRTHIPLGVLLLVVGLALPATASAQGASAGATSERVRVQFVDMKDLFVDGRVARPSMAFVDARQRARFDRLLRLKHEVVGALRATGTDAALR